ncbi:exported hypothetical protein [Candidatus Propionivibrio aalborgensis]|uniref:Uncharacterized protein n=1 Tax=Candidatus Propionivibrio aalborgensis TaxID=1860101 RepID=A0A1A8XXX2_9RHOO|nr:exported hypothetical protein [Candidatus Propionivibrio aalborgensis]
MDLHRFMAAGVGANPLLAHVAGDPLYCPYIWYIWGHPLAGPRQASKVPHGGVSRRFNFTVTPHSR